jgi:hypothetical protein
MRDFHLSWLVNQTERARKYEDKQWPTESGDMLELRDIISRHITQSICILIPSKESVWWVQQLASCCYAGGIVCKFREEWQLAISSGYLRIG